MRRIIYILNLILIINLISDAQVMRRRVTGIDDNLYFILSGQSNAWGATMAFQGDTAGSANVQIWDSTMQAWKRATIGEIPFRVEGYNQGASAVYDSSNNLGLHFAKRVNEETGNPVRLILLPRDGTSITAWTSGTALTALETQMQESGADQKQISGFLWQHGESDYSQSFTWYSARFDTIKTWLRSQTWFDSTTRIMVGKHVRNAPSASNFNAWADSLDTIDVYVRAIDTTDLTNNGYDSVHFGGASLVTLGYEYYWDKWLTDVPIMLTTTATAVGTDSAIVHGRVNDDGGRYDSIRFVYGTTVDFGDSTDWIGEYRSAETFDDVISSLSDGTKFYFRAEGKNSAGIGYGNIDSLITQVATSYLLSEDAEGTGTPTGWTDAGTCNWDYATSPAPLVGAQSLHLAASANTYKSFTGNATIYGYVTFVALTSNANQRPVNIEDASGNALAYARCYGVDNTLYIANGSVTASGVIPITAGTQYHLWYRYVKGTGSNSVFDVYLSTTTTKPGSPSQSITNGTATANAARLRMYGLSGAIILDKMRVDDIDIGSNPP